MHKRALLHNVREERLAGPGADAQWRIDPAAFEFRDDSEGFYTYRGEASVVEHAYTVRDMWGEFSETIAAGAFDKTLRENPAVSFVYMHDMATVMASTRSGSLTLSADPHLSVVAQLDKNDHDVQRLAPKAVRGDAASMSFAFRVTRQEWDEDYTNRRILEVNLNGGDVSAIVTGHGANPAAWGTLRSDLDLDTVLRWIDGPITADELVRLEDAARARRGDGYTINIHNDSPAGHTITEVGELVFDAIRSYEDRNPLAEVPQSIREDLAALYALGASLHPAA